MGTYLSLHFSVRARALSSLIIREYTPIVTEQTSNQDISIGDNSDRHCLRKVVGLFAVVPN